MNHVEKPNGDYAILSAAVKLLVTR